VWGAPARRRSHEHTGSTGARSARPGFDTGPPRVRTARRTALRCPPDREAGPV